MTGSASLPIGNYRLDMPIDSLTGLSEFSEAEYTMYGRRFEGEKNYHAPGVDFLNRHWNVDIGTVAGKVYKIALYLESENKETASDDSAGVIEYCQERLGAPSEHREGMTMWDTFDGNVVVQFATVGTTHMMNLFETSRATRTFPAISPSRAAEWQTVPTESAYWHPVNRGFTKSNAKFMCPKCGMQCPLPTCPDCGCENSQLGKLTGIPGVFCERCGSGGFSWTCPGCGKVHRAMLVFYYDVLAIKVRKKRFWE